MYYYKLPILSLYNFRIMTLIFIYLFVILFVLIVLIISASVGVPFLPTNYKRAKQMMDLADIKTGSSVVDLGSGAGRLLFLAAARGATAVGYELNPILCWWTKIMIFLKWTHILKPLHNYHL